MRAMSFGFMMRIGGGERYEKALQKDNERSNDYFAIRRQILEAEAVRWGQERHSS